ncbi:MAG TPA: hypothetical protein VLU73_11075 [Methylococcaceae bacterium]|nr:hypothetical protein [Methylococcaceae bacterium]
MGDELLDDGRTVLIVDNPKRRVIGMLIFIISISIIPFLILIWRWFFADNKNQHHSKNTRSASLFHAVTIECGMDCCEAVNKLKDKRLLSNEAPLLPLPACDAAQCDCRYVHFNDRRDDDRRHPYTALTEVLGTSDQRSGEDRRL